MAKDQGKSLNSKNLSLVKKVGNKTQFTILDSTIFVVIKSQIFTLFDSFVKVQL